MATGRSSSQHQASDLSSSQHQASDFSSSQHQASDFSSSQHQASYVSSSIHKGSATLDTSEQCQKHKDNKLELFCNVHDVLICSRCLINSHKKCTKRVVMIDDKVQTMQQTGDFTKLIQMINTLKQEMAQKNQYFESNAERLQMTFEEQLDKINALRKKVNQTLDELESNTIKELNSLLKKLKTPLQDDIDKCTDAISRIQSIQDEIQKIDKSTETLKLILYRKCLQKSSEIESLKSKMVTNSVPTITFIPESSIEKTLSLSSLGKFINPNTIIKVTGETKYNIKRWGNFSTCSIAHICETDSGDLLVIDKNNEEVKLLDKDFKVVTHYKLPTIPRSMCSIGARVVAVTLDNKEVHFIRVNNVGQLVKKTKLDIIHECTSIAHHNGNLYIASGAALYNYTVNGRLVSKIYESRRERVNACDISPDGTKVYVGYGMQLVTLSLDGTVINIFTIFPRIEDDPKFYDERLYNLHVTDSGQVLMLCYMDSHKTIQLDSDGRQILSEVVTGKHWGSRPASVYYSKNRAALIVGMWNSDYILVFKT